MSPSPSSSSSSSPEELIDNRRGSWGSHLWTFDNEELDHYKDNLLVAWPLDELHGIRADLIGAHGLEPLRPRVPGGAEDSSGRRFVLFRNNAENSNSYLYSPYQILAGRTNVSLNFWFTIMESRSNHYLFWEGYRVDQTGPTIGRRVEGGAIVEVLGNCAYNTRFGIRYSGGKLQIGLRDEVGYLHTYDIAIKLEDFEWYNIHIDLDLDRQSLLVYIGNNLLSSFETTFRYLFISAFTSTICLGGRLFEGPYGTGEQLFGGALDNFFIWQGSLVEGARAALFNNGAPRDLRHCGEFGFYPDLYTPRMDGLNAYNHTLSASYDIREVEGIVYESVRGRHGMIRSEEPHSPIFFDPVIGYHIRADGESYVDLKEQEDIIDPDAIGWTISAWIKLSMVPPDTFGRTIFCEAIPNHHLPKIWFGLTSHSHPYLTLGYLNRDLIYHNLGLSVNRITNNLWTHVAVVVNRNSGRGQMYINGRTQAYDVGGNGRLIPTVFDFITQGLPHSPPGAAKGIGIAYPLRRGNDRGIFTGSIAHVSIWNAPLPTFLIQNLYNLGKPVSFKMIKSSHFSQVRPSPVVFF